MAKKQAILQNDISDWWSANHEKFCSWWLSSTRVTGWVATRMTLHGSQHIFFSLATVTGRGSISRYKHIGDVYIYIMLYIITLYYIISYSTIFYSILSYCIILYYIILYSIISYHIISYHIILYYIILYCIVLYYIILYYIILYCKYIKYLLRSWIDSTEHWTLRVQLPEQTLSIKTCQESD